MSDEAEIRALIGAHFDALGWEKGGRPDWERFNADFLPEAVLYPSARPAVQWSLADFAARMNRVAEEVLETFEEATLGMTVQVFGNIAVVLAASRMLENGRDENHDVSGYLLVRTDGAWKIAAHAWDKASEDRPVPAALR